MSHQIRGTYGTMYYVKDMAKAVMYYKENLGLKPRFESPEWTEFDLNGHGLCLHAMGKDEKGLNQKGVGLLILDVKGLVTMVAELKKKGVEFIGEMKEVHPGAHSIEFKDPSDNVISLYEDSNRK